MPNSSSSLDAFYFVMAAVLLALGLWLLRDRTSYPRLAKRSSEATIIALAVVVGVIGGIYGIGGGSILAPLLIALGFSITEVAPATLAATLLTSLAGIATFALLSIDHTGSIAPDWTLGIALGIGGLLGGYVGARLQPRMPSATITRLLGILSVVLAVRYAVTGAA